MVVENGEFWRGVRGRGRRIWMVLGLVYGVFRSKSSTGGGEDERRSDGCCCSSRRSSGGRKKEGAVVCEGEGGLRAEGGCFGGDEERVKGFPAGVFWLGEGGAGGSIAGNYGGCGGGRRRRECGIVLLRLWCCCLVGVNGGLVVSAGCSSGGIPAMVRRVESEGFRSAVREKRVAPLLVSPEIMVVEGSGNDSGFLVDGVRR
ncbi:hypothetical protein HAX54_034953 [Datura stramonium]|uniref:Uncharacterized protein n=1 Tax=Datura stramonium TaxID=4076 RepID=A0ABS8Y5T5_DATST|nr:hypothetical protein [Datura stramonium]